MPRLEIVTEIAASIGRVFDLARSIDVHQQSQTRHRERAVAGRTSGLIEAGETVTWEAVHFAIRQRLTSRIDAMTRPLHFRDSMVAGAFRSFVHDHHFEEIPGGTRMTDVDRCGKLRREIPVAGLPAAAGAALYGFAPLRALRFQSQV